MPGTFRGSKLLPTQLSCTLPPPSVQSPVPNQSADATARLCRTTSGQSSSAEAQLEACTLSGPETCLSGQTQLSPASAFRPQTAGTSSPSESSQEPRLQAPGKANPTSGSKSRQDAPETNPGKKQYERKRTQISLQTIINKKVLNQESSLPGSALPFISKKVSD